MVSLDPGNFEYILKVLQIPGIGVVWSYGYPKTLHKCDRAVNLVNELGDDQPVQKHLKDPEASC